MKSTPGKLRVTGIVGSSQHQELGVPSEELTSFNKAIVGRIELQDAFFGPSFMGHVPENYGLQGRDAIAQFMALSGQREYSTGFLPKLRKSPLAGAFLDGVNAAAVALMAIVGWQFGRAALVSMPAIVLALASVVLVFRYKINSTWLVLGGAAVGIALRLLRWIQATAKIMAQARFCRAPRARERLRAPAQRLSTEVPCRRLGAGFRFRGRRQLPQRFRWSLPRWPPKA